MPDVKSVSLSREQAVFIEKKMFSPSKILQRAIKRLMDGEEDAEYYKLRVEILAQKLDNAVKFIEKEGLTDVFMDWEEARNKRTRNKQANNESRPARK